eukprot:3872427-Pleurochrysis_carterae.AAC.3
MCDCHLSSAVFFVVLLCSLHIYRCCAVIRVSVLCSPQPSSALLYFAAFNSRTYRIQYASPRPLRRATLQLGRENLV